MLNLLCPENIEVNTIAEFQQIEQPVNNNVVEIVVSQCDWIQKHKCFTNLDKLVLPSVLKSWIHAAVLL